MEGNETMHIHIVLLYMYMYWYMVYSHTHDVTGDVERKKERYLRHWKNENECTSK